MQQPLVRPMGQGDLEAADRVHRIAFGTRFGLPDPVKFRGDAEVVRLRWAIDPTTSFVAEADGAIIGGACAMDWGSVFIIGPVFVLPEHARRGIARLLMQRMVELAEERRAALAGLFTFPESATHLRLYEGFGFASQALTPILTKAVAGSGPPACIMFSKLPATAQAGVLLQCGRVADANFPGLDLSREIQAIATLGLGETILLGVDDDIRGFALCHSGAGSEGGSGTVFIKFAAVRPRAEQDFSQLIACCEGLATSLGAQRIVAGTNTARSSAYRILRQQGFRAGLVGVAMHRPDGPGFNRPDVLAVDDWR
jgi:predicted N-acetyltransferase YhbS